MYPAGVFHYFLWLFVSFRVDLKQNSVTKQKRKIKNKRAYLNLQNCCFCDTLLRTEYKVK